MPDAFGPALERWHDFYMLSGATSGVLLGLLFVAVSEHLSVLTGDGRALAYETFNHFIAVLALALICLIPGLGPPELGVGLLIVGLLGCARLSRRVRFRMPYPHPWRRDVFPALAYVLLLVLGLLLVASAYSPLGGSAVADPTPLLDWLLAVSFLLLIQTALSAWEMLVYMGTGHDQQAGQPRSE